jgi:Flp pilus assembly protein TadG
VIAGWLAKIVIIIALLGFAAVELGSPLWTRAQLDGIAHDAADEAARAFEDQGKTDQARKAAEDKAAADDAVITSFSGPDNQGRIHVTVFREAKSYLLHNFGPTKDWYAVSVEATSQTKR